jgi:hypothetical protein
MPLPDGAAAEMRVIVEDVERAGVVQKRTGWQRAGRSRATRDATV